MTQTFSPPPSREPEILENKIAGGRGDETTSLSKIDIPLSQYETINFSPYTVKFFEIDNYEHLNELTDINHIKEKIETIEDYIFNQIEKRNLNDNTKTYNDLITELFSKIGVEENETNISKLFRLSKFLQISDRNEQKNRENRRKEMQKKQEKVEKEKQIQEKIKENYDKLKHEKSEMVKELDQYKEKTILLERQAAEESQRNSLYKTQLEELMEAQRQRIEEMESIKQQNEYLKSLIS